MGEYIKIIIICQDKLLNIPIPKDKFQKIANIEISILKHCGGQVKNLVIEYLNLKFICILFFEF